MIKKLFYIGLTLTITTYSIFAQDDKNFEMAILEAKNKNYRIADSLLTESIKSINFEDKYLALYNRGYCRQQLDSIVLSNQDFYHCLKLRKNFYPAYEGLVINHLLYDSLDLAEKFSDTALTSLGEKRNLEMYVLRNMIFFEKNEFKKVIINSGIGLSKRNDIRLYGDRAIANLQLDEKLKAKKDLDFIKKTWGDNYQNYIEANLCFLAEADKIKFCEVLNQYSITEVSRFSLLRDFYSLEMEGCNQN